MDNRLVRIVAIVIVIIALIGIGGLADNFSTFFYGGTTEGVHIDKNGDITGESKTLSYATGYIKSDYFGITYWTLKPSSEAGYNIKAPKMEVFFDTQPSRCIYSLREVSSTPLRDTVNKLNLEMGSDWRVLKPSGTWTREQKIDVAVFGPSSTEQKVADTLKTQLAQVNVLSFLSAPVKSILDSAPYKGTFDVYKDDVVSVGPNNIYRILMPGTFQGMMDCGGLIDDDTAILYSSSKNEIYAINSRVFDYQVSSLDKLPVLKTYLTSYEHYLPVGEYKLDSIDLKDKTFYMYGGSLKVVNPSPGMIPLTIILPTNLFYNPISGEVYEEETPGTVPVESEFDKYGEPQPCNLRIVDIAFSGDNRNYYEEGSEFTTYVKVENLESYDCSVSLKIESASATGNRWTGTIEGKTIKQIPLTVRLGYTTSESCDTINYKACSESTVSGPICDQRGVHYCIYDTDNPISELTKEESPDPEPELTCVERARSIECPWNDYACMWSRQFNEWNCYEYFLPSILAIGGGFGVLLVIIFGAILIGILKKQRIIK